MIMSHHAHEIELRLPMKWAVACPRLLTSWDSSRFRSLLGGLFWGCWCLLSYWTILWCFPHFYFQPHYHPPPLSSQPPPQPSPIDSSSPPSPQFCHFRRIFPPPVMFIPDFPLSPPLGHTSSLLCWGFQQEEPSKAISIRPSSCVLRYFPNLLFGGVFTGWGIRVIVRERVKVWVFGARLQGVWGSVGQGTCLLELQWEPQWFFRFPGPAPHLMLGRSGLPYPRSVWCPLSYWVLNHKIINRLWARRAFRSYPKQRPLPSRKYPPGRTASPNGPAADRICNLNRWKKSKCLVAGHLEL